MAESQELVARYDDGSAIRRDRDSLAIDADAGLAGAALADAERVSALPLDAMIAWTRAAPATERAVLAAVLERRFEHESFWLFRAEPIASVPSPGDQASAASLEKRVATFDEAVRTGELGDPRESARRRVIHAELRSASLIANPLLERKAEVLEELGCVHLAELARAAHRLALYYVSPERARLVSAPPPDRLDAGALSMDWARSIATAPAGATLFAWWGFCEATFCKHPPSGERGKLIVSQGPIVADLRWRLEDGEHHALYEVEVVDRRSESGSTPSRR